MTDSALIFDIETIADLTPQNCDAIAALGKSREMTAEEYGALCPPLARVVCIAWFDVAAQQLGALFDITLGIGAWPSAVDIDAEPRATRICRVQGCDGEPELLRQFGLMVEHHLGQADARLVTYNGRGFDLPVLIHRSIKHRVSAGRELLLKAVTENRYQSILHVDLLDTVTFNGAANRWPMAAYAIGYGWRSPKQDMNGAQVSSAVQAGRIVDVVRYCAGDVLATACVYEKIVAREA